MACIVSNPELLSEDWINAPERQIRDQLLAAAILVGTAPIIGAAALGHMGEDGTFIYSQKRLGQGAEPFVIHKIRSLKVDTPLTPSYGVNDPRATRLGRILRKSHIDELPQLYNILKGDMVFFGPRPLIGLDFENARSTLSRNRYDEWEDAYMRSKPGGISTFAIATRSNLVISGPSQSWELRAMNDIYDFHNMSRKHERKLAASVIRLAAQKLTHRS